MTLHYTSGGSFDSEDNFGPVSAGFNLADVQTVEQLNALPDGVQGLIWLDQSDGVTQSFIDEVTPFIGNPKLFGFYLVDEPDPTGQWGKQVDAEDLRAEADWIHANVPGALTYITLMNMGSSDDPDYSNTYNPQNTHVDLFGIDVYPVRSGSSTVDYDMITEHVQAAEDAGVPVDQMVPVYQAFGGGAYWTDTGEKHVLPTTEQLQQMLDTFEAAIPNPVFDYAYSWASQEGTTAIENSPELQAFFRERNAEDGSAVVDPLPADPVEPTVPTDPADPVDSGSENTGGSDTGSDNPVNAGGDDPVNTGSDDAPTAPEEQPDPVEPDPVEAAPEPEPPAAPGGNGSGGAHGGRGGWWRHDGGRDDDGRDGFWDRADFRWADWPSNEDGHRAGRWTTDDDADSSSRGSVSANSTAGVAAHGVDLAAILQQAHEHAANHNWHW